MLRLADEMHLYKTAGIEKFCQMHKSKYLAKEFLHQKKLLQNIN